MLVCIGWSVLQHGKGSSRTAPKLHGVIQALQNAGFKTVFLNHVETFPRRSFYRTDLKVRLVSSALLLRALASAGSIDSEEHSGIFSFLRLHWHKARIEYWYSMMLWLRSEAIVGTNLTLEQMLAARKLRIPAIEVQHGIMKQSFYVQHWAEIAPDILACWRVPGQDFVEQLGVMRLEIPFPVSASPSLPDPLEKKRALVLLEWGLTDSIDPWGAVAATLHSTLVLLQKEFSELSFRLHPVFPRRYWKSLKSFIKSEFPTSRLEPVIGVGLESSLKDFGTVILDSSSSYLESLLLRKRVITSNASTFAAMKSFITDLGIDAEIAYRTSDAYDFFTTNGGENSWVLFDHDDLVCAIRNWPRGHRAKE